MRVFLGGTCNGSKWRDKLIPDLQVDYFNPILPAWTEEAYVRELHDLDQAQMQLKNLRAITGLDSIEGFSKSLELIGKVIVDLSNHHHSDFGNLLEIESVRLLIDEVRGKEITDYFDIPNWITSLVEDRTLMEIVHQSVSPTE